MNDDLVLTADDLSLTKSAEACYLTAYPDPASALAQKLVALGLWAQTLRGVAIPASVLALGLIGAPWTIGYGHTGPEVHQGLVWTQPQADAALLADMSAVQANVRAHVTVALTKPEFVALCDFAYNVGTGNFDTSTLLKLLDAGDFEGAAAQFARWNLAGGVVLAGLVKRRGAEAALFLSGLVQATTATT
ncbi:lysozyme [Pararobbsia silviterrae]|uniref:Lysozyme n=1 Tax=Pararobbsia silviterrae TaxID=1792498 RepID=A0A494X2V0_9BURK|nr:lysozyme [Pararobbsia silviterrae]RKP44692.1 lysozyme [Pararobbsia silviterrae]